jgi:signal transduction histidine kinase
MTESLQRVRAIDRRHPLLWDVAPVVPVALLSLNVSPGLDTIGLVALAVGHGAAVFRRRRALPALAIAVAAVLVGGAAGLVSGSSAPWLYLALWMLLFNLGLRGRPRLLVVGASILVIVAAAFLFPYGPDPRSGAERISFVIAVLGMSAASYLGGLQLRAGRARVLAERTEFARAAVVGERSRIAQEMHDIIGHNLSVITALATGGATAARTSPVDAALAFEAIGDVSRSSMREVGRVLSVLRDDRTAGSPLSPQPGVGDIDSLVDSVRSAGLEVRLERTGDAGALSGGHQLAVYRIVQEALTNVLRHAGARATASVRVAVENDGVIVSIGNDGVPPGWTDRRDAVVSGHGIIGMRERAGAYGGTLDAGPTATGWRVVARIPTGRGTDS